ncbi:MAG TPA: tripartite tricarboxylate transporter substrate binding protein [Candidatus Lachnoclostridium pullistercoris]|uniref:Tripartite tricarboxylate transporter substrate binding protein n=1 Tax=Candidatus Lachnoclostridium pullistercoris TaxID=2838632 RepID=A0A9D2PFS7_9FIRM|nr:tripartite tricarboxylate transporter substrate binding protein [Candidatus Lachnoclostridium pullistercoris]
MLLIMAAVALMTAFLMSCTVKETEMAAEDVYPREAVEMIAPAGPGSGFDLTIRAVSQCLIGSGLVLVPLPVTNKPGKGGSAALEYLAGKRGEDNVLSIFSPPICLVHLNGTTSYNYKENTTPVAKLLVDYGCFAVRCDSPYESIGDVMDALREDPGSLTVGGTSSVWSMDHIQFLSVARAAGVDGLDQIVYEGYENGGAVSSLMGGRIDVLSAGISDVVGLMESGDLRVLAVTAGERLENEKMAEVPTCREEGIDVEFSNWRGLFGPADMPDYALEYWERTLKEMSETDGWRETCSRYGWTEDFEGHEEFGKFLDGINEEYQELLDEVKGLEPALQ